VQQVSKMIALLSCITLTLSHTAIARAWSGVIISGCDTIGTLYDIKWLQNPPVNTNSFDSLPLRLLRNNSNNVRIGMVGWVQGWTLLAGSSVISHHRTVRHSPSIGSSRVCSIQPRDVHNQSQRHFFYRRDGVRYLCGRSNSITDEGINPHQVHLYDAIELDALLSVWSVWNSKRLNTNILI